MNLLESTSTLIDAVKTSCRPENDRKLMSAVKRMERRLAVLQLRAAKALKRRRHKGWADLQHLAPSCYACNEVFAFGDFVKSAELNHRGDIIRFDCPVCEACIVLLMECDGIEAKRCQTYVVWEFKNGKMSLGVPPCAELRPVSSSKLPAL